MKCSFCGNEVPFGATFCPECGHAVAAEEQKVEVVETSGVTNDVAITSSEKNMGIVSYITWIGFIIAMISDVKDSDYVKFHLNQSLIIHIASIIVSCFWFTRPLGFVVFVFWILGLVSAINGEKKSLPLCENIKIIK